MKALAQIMDINPNGSDSPEIATSIIADIPMNSNVAEVVPVVNQTTTTNTSSYTTPTTFGPLVDGLINPVKETVEAVVSPVKEAIIDNTTKATASQKNYLLYGLLGLGGLVILMKILKK